MEAEGLDVKRMIAVPAAIALAVTLRTTGRGVGRLTVVLCTQPVEFDVCVSDALDSQACHTVRWEFGL